MNTTDKQIISKEFSWNKGKYFSWSAVVVGALIGIGVSFLLNLFGISIGLVAFRHATDSTSLTFTIGGFIALIIASIVSMSILGVVAGYLGALQKLECNRTDLHCNYGCLYGFTAWCLALILSVFLAVPASKFIYYTTTALSNPTLILTTDTYKSNQASNTNVTHMTQPTSSTSDEEIAKQLAMASFLSFVIFFIGALSATIAGHLAFDRCFKKHGNYQARLP